MTVVVSALMGTPGSNQLNMRQVAYTNMVDTDQAKGRFLTYVEEFFPDEKILGRLLFTEVPETGVDPQLVREFFALADVDLNVVIDDLETHLEKYDAAKNALREAVGL